MDALRLCVDALHLTTDAPHLALELICRITVHDLTELATFDASGSAPTTWMPLTTKPTPEAKAPTSNISLSS